jgi:hypothetical protein
MVKERDGGDLKYIELCARQIARVAKDDKIVVENQLCPCEHRSY